MKPLYFFRADVRALLGMFLIIMGGLIITFAYSSITSGPSESDKDFLLIFLTCILVFGGVLAHAESQKIYLYSDRLELIRFGSRTKIVYFKDISFIRKTYFKTGQGRYPAIAMYLHNGEVVKVPYAPFRKHFDFILNFIDKNRGGASK